MLRECKWVTNVHAFKSYLQTPQLGVFIENFRWQFLKLIIGQITIKEQTLHNVKNRCSEVCYTDKFR